MSFALYWAWVFMAILSPIALSDFSLGASQPIRIAGSLGIAAGLALQYAVLPKASVIDSKFHATIALLFPCAHATLLLLAHIGALSLPTELYVATSFLAGVASTLLLNSIGAAFALYERKRGIYVTCLASMMGAVIAAMTTLTPSEVMLACEALLIPASVILFRRAKLIPAPETKQDRIHARESILLYRPLLAFMFLFGLMFGLLIAQTTAVSISAEDGVIFLIAVASSGIIMIFIVETSRIPVDVESLQRVLLALATILLGALLVADGWPALLCMLALTVCFGVFDMASFVTLYEIIRENNLPQLSTFALGRIPCESGIALGWLAGAVVEQAFPAEQKPILIAAFAVAALVIVMLAVMGSGNKMRTRDSVATPAQSASVAFGQRGEGDAAPKREIAAMAEQFALSPRETEVLEMLAAGRSPKRIAEKLFISESTAKSHCYRIYKKTGVHSQQDLLDLIEERMRAAEASRWKLIP